jgi:hypothetical protein
MPQTSAPFLRAAAASLAVAGLAACASAPTADPTIYHTVRMQLREDADPAKVEEVMALMRELGEKVDGVDRFMVGSDLADDYDVSATYVLAGYDAYRTYLFDPVHLEIDRNGLPLVRNMVSFDVTDAEDAGAAQQRIAQLHKDRVEQVPGLKELLAQMESYTGEGK